LDFHEEDLGQAWDLFGLNPMMEKHSKSSKRSKKGKGKDTE
jgi:hypothetical protein